MVKIKVLVVFFLFSLIFSEAPIIENECSSLGNNAPLNAMDCKIFKFNNNKQWCCYFTVTNTTSYIDEETMTTEYLKSKGTACVVLDKITSAAKREKLDIIRQKISGDRMLIQCGSFYYRLKILFYLFLFFL
jgi:hypothetical protein